MGLTFGDQKKDQVFPLVAMGDHRLSNMLFVFPTFWNSVNLAVHCQHHLLPSPFLLKLFYSCPLCCPAFLLNI